MDCENDGENTELWKLLNARENMINPAIEKTNSMETILLPFAVAVFK